MRRRKIDTSDKNDAGFAVTGKFLRLLIVKLLFRDALVTSAEACQFSVNDTWLVLVNTVLTTLTYASY